MSPFCTHTWQSTFSHCHDSIIACAALWAQQSHASAKWRGKVRTWHLVTSKRTQRILERKVGNFCSWRRRHVVVTSDSDPLCRQHVIQQQEKKRSCQLLQSPPTRRAAAKGSGRVAPRWAPCDVDLSDRVPLLQLLLLCARVLLAFHRAIQRPNDRPIRPDCSRNLRRKPL